MFKVRYYLQERSFLKSFCAISGRKADRSRVVVTSSGFFCSENSKTLRVNQASTAWLAWEDSNFHITISKNTFEMSTEFPPFWPKIRLGDFCRLQVVNEQTRQVVKHQTESLTLAGQLPLWDAF